MSVSFVTIVFDDDNFNEEAVCKVISDVNQSGIESGLSFEMIVIDNSKQPIVAVQNLCCDINAIHQWNCGFNVYHGVAMNIAAELSTKDAVVYFCSGHSRVIDHSWVFDILAPLRDSKCGAAGTIGPCLFAVISADPKDHKIKQIHIQGAICAIRRDILVDIPYSNRWPHGYSDVSMSLSLINRGYKLVDVPSVRSVGYGKANPVGAKIIHEYL